MRAARLLRPDLWEFALPIAKDMRALADDLRNLADAKESLLFGKGALLRAHSALGAAGRRRFTLAAPGVQDLLQHLAGPEGEHATCGDHDLIARLRVSPNPRGFCADDKIAEARKLDLFALAEDVLHFIEDRLDNLSRLLLGETADLFVDGINQLGLRHLGPFLLP